MEESSAVRDGTQHPKNKTPSTTNVFLFCHPSLLIVIHYHFFLHWLQHSFVMCRKKQTQMISASL
ncbi:hypothetical protein BHE74_00007171 [Ensete ventricosum]|uniref:Uncharacterized protein n=1 Tax=Ensete ventricosum TaxID=4639 RepID=A0A426ZPT3_ENSVE|nr:hypothetical protein B296_00018024 [Ensete ventricosum]RWW20529.1 hypothetical protein GW17_00015354 [Ensete ventricosum]RWW84229.1 hypothetical protein BHE74_00007171 [Ensete ventricosum]RZR86398.1 hypothetical protein BHM03_00013586 [Ensete ventricosum]